MVKLRCFGRVGVWMSASFLTAASLGAQVLSDFVPVTPCRLVDTRTSNGLLGSPSMAAGSTRSFPFPMSNCGLPSNATGYSLNVTVVPLAGLSYVSIWPTGVHQPVVSTLNDSEGEVIANAAVVQAGTGGAVSVFVTDTTDVIIDVDGYFVASPVSTSSATDNTTLGLNALPVSAGAQNTGIGFAALNNNSSGNFNTALGSTALSTNSSGSDNTAIGQSALTNNTSGVNNTAVGSGALSSESSGTDNVAVGYLALNGGTGSTNVALGSQSLLTATGNGNIGIGYQAGNTLSTGSNNIDIGNVGVNSDDGVIRIGTPGTQASTVIAGIFGNNITGGATVVIDANGQLGVSSSSRRYKEDIHPMSDSSNRLMQLEPVTFRYKQTASDGSHDLQYGLIAEQVAAVYPELAVYGKDGQVETVQYQQLPAMLLNEIQKQHKTIEDLESRIAALEQLLKTNTSAVAH